MTGRIFIAGILVFFSTLFSPQQIFAQGCSDAGFCSAGSLQASTDDDSTKKSTIALKAVYGAGEKGVTIIQLMPELEWSFGKHSSVQASIPLVMTSGKLGDHSGVGDAMISYSHAIPFNEKLNFGLTGGFRIPVGTTDQEYIGKTSLPMPYQTGLGTTDLILGGVMNYSKWQVAVGYQMVLRDNNKNTYTDFGLGYFSSNKLQRGDDALLRAGRMFDLGKLKLTPSVLAIYRVNKDIIETPFGNEIELEGSDGLTLNLNVAATWMFLDALSLRLDVGAPAVVRDYRADGLTRSSVAALAVRYHF